MEKGRKMGKMFKGNGNRGEKTSFLPLNLQKGRKTDFFWSLRMFAVASYWLLGLWYDF